MMRKISFFTAASVAATLLSGARIGAQTAAAAAAPDTAWRIAHTDTIGDLVVATQTSNGRIRISGHGLKSPTPVTSADFSRDSVSTWLTSVDQFAAIPTPKSGDMRSIGGAVAITATTTSDGKNAFGCYIQDAMSDNTLALALTREQVAKFTAAIRAGLAAAG